MTPHAILRTSLVSMHSLLDKAVDGMTAEHFNFRPQEGGVSAFFSLWHYVRTEDNIVNFVVQREPTVWLKGEYDQRFQLHRTGQGTGMTVDEARQSLGNAGFEVIVGDPVDSAESEGVVAAQNPGAGRVAGGTTITISPSNGQGTTVPDVTGQQLNTAVGALRGAGFGNVTDGTCTVDASAPGQGRVTSTAPAAGSAVNRNAAITVNYSARDCDD